MSWPDDNFRCVPGYDHSPGSNTIEGELNSDDNGCVAMLWRWPQASNLSKSH